jgi:hypothetical protein
LGKLNQPRNEYLKSLKDWLKDIRGGNSTLRGKEAFIWEPFDINNNSTKHDMVTIARSKGEQDVFTKALLLPSVNLYHRLWGHKRAKNFIIDEESGMVEYSEEKLDKVGMVISTTLSSILPVVAVLALYGERDLLKRIYIMIAITATFAILLAIFSNARRIGIFAATAT